MPYAEGLNIHFTRKVGTLVEPEDSLAGPHNFECLFEDHAGLRLVISVKVWVTGWETGYMHESSHKHTSFCVCVCVL